MMNTKFIIPHDRRSCVNQKIRIRLKAYDHEIIDQSARKIVDTVTRTGARRPNPMPTHREVRLLRDPQIPTRTRTRGSTSGMRTHKRLIDILDPTPKTVDDLMRLDLPAGVDIEIKL